MKRSFDQIIRVRGIERDVAILINNLDSIQLLINKGRFKEVKTLPGIHIYDNQDRVYAPNEIMLIFKDGRLVDRRLQRSVK